MLLGLAVATQVLGGPRSHGVGVTELLRIGHATVELDPAQRRTVGVPVAAAVELPCLHEIERRREQVGIAGVLRRGESFLDGRLGLRVTASLALDEEEAPGDEQERALRALGRCRAEPAVDQLPDLVCRRQVAQGSDPARAEERSLPREAGVGGIAVGEDCQSLAVRAPRVVAEEREIVEVAERLEGLDLLRAGLGEHDGAAREALALHDREAAVRVRGCDQELGAGLAAQVVLAEEREGRVVVMREPLRELAGALAAVSSIQAATSA